VGKRRNPRSAIFYPFFLPSLTNNKSSFQQSTAVMASSTVPYVPRRGDTNQLVRESRRCLRRQSQDRERSCEASAFESRSSRAKVQAFSENFLRSAPTAAGSTQPCSTADCGIESIAGNHNRAAFPARVAAPVRLAIRWCGRKMLDRNFSEASRAVGPVRSIHKRRYARNHFWRRTHCQPRSCGNTASLAS